MSKKVTKLKSWDFNIKTAWEIHHLSETWSCYCCCCEYEDKRDNHSSPWRQLHGTERNREMWEVPRSGKRNWGTMEIKSKSSSSGGWGFGSQKLNAYFIETGNSKDTGSVKS